MTYFDQFDPINDINPNSCPWTWLKYFFKNFRENFFSPLSPIFDLWRHFDPQNGQILNSDKKMTYFEEIEPINDICDQIKVYKPEWNNF